MWPQARPYIKESRTVLALSKDSQAKLIQRSQACRDIWQELPVELGQEDTVLKNMGYAGRRFDSMSKLLRRIIIKFHATVDTAHLIIRRRDRSTREHGHHGSKRALDAP